MELLKELTILYAEDDPSTRENITKTLELLCAQVISVENGEEALLAFGEKSPHVVMLDYVMPKMDGFQAAKAIRKIDKKVPICIASSYTDKEKLMGVMELGLMDYLEKPLDFATLKNALEKCATSLYENQGFIAKLNLNCYYHIQKKEIIYSGLTQKLSTKEHQLLDLLLKNKGHIVTMEMVEEALYPQGAHKNALRNLIYRLRTKCGVEAISTINDRGYTLCVASL